MPTPRQLDAIYRQQLLAAQGDFEVHEVVECVSEGEEGFGEEDLLQNAADTAKSSEEEGEAGKGEEVDEAEDLGAKLEKLALHAGSDRRLPHSAAMHEADSTPAKAGLSLSDLSQQEQSIFLRAAAGSKTASKKKGPTPPLPDTESNSCGRGGGTKPPAA